jgi:hypothetical protein
MKALRVVVLVGLVYCVAGLVFGTLAGQAGSARMTVVWRWAAWIVSAVAFGSHIVHEQRLGSSLKSTAMRVAAAAGLGSFGLAVAANIHALTVAPTQRSPLMLPSLAIWPVMTAIPAFLVALVAAAIVARVRQLRSP